MMLTTKETAHELGVSIRTLQRWVRAGVLRQRATRQRGVRLVRYASSDIKQLLSYTRQMATPATTRLAN